MEEGGGREEAMGKGRRRKSVGEERGRIRGDKYEGGGGGGGVGEEGMRKRWERRGVGMGGGAVAVDGRRAIGIGGRG